MLMADNDHEARFIEPGGNELVLSLSRDHDPHARKLNIGIYEPGDADGTGITLTMKQASALKVLLMMMGVE